MSFIWLFSKINEIMNENGRITSKIYYDEIHDYGQLCAFLN